jgi:hypothetical protein
VFLLAVFGQHGKSEMVEATLITLGYITLSILLLLVAAEAAALLRGIKAVAVALVAIVLL